MPNDVLIIPASSKIEFTDGVNATKTLKITGTSLNVDTSFAIGATTANNTLSVLGSASIGSAFNVAAPTNGLIVQGEVGIGTTSFVYSAANRGLLEIYGSAESLIALKHATGNLYIQKTSVDTYINNSGAGFISIATNSSERWRITSAGVLQSNGAQTLQTSTGNLTLATAASGHILLSPTGGNVGVGTTTASSNFHVYSLLGSELRLSAGGTGSGGLRFLKGDSGESYINNQDSYAMRFQIAGSTRMSILADGNVGIGTTNPAAILTVQSNGAQLRLQTLSGPASYFSNIGSRYDSSHPFTIEVANGAATATEYFGIYADGGGANNRIALLNGNVGIGTTSPSEKLEVIGAIKGTSFSGAGTGLTGTASNLTAGTVTTNANLTGPITSVGNTTTITNSAVTYSKIQDVIGPAVIGRLTGTGVASALSGADIATIIGSNTITNAVTAGTANALNTANSYQAVSLNLTGTLQFDGNINWNHGVTTELGRKTIGFNIWQGGKKLNADEDFSYGNNNITVYNNYGGTALTITRTALATAPNSSGFVLRVSYTPGSNGTTPGFGGFFFGTGTSANKVFATRFIANIPTGRTLNFQSNSFGTNTNAYWLTNNVGTGKWEEYVFVVMCGNTGTFSSTNFFNISGGADVAFTWDIASATVFDVTNKRDVVSGNFESYQSSNAITFNYLATNLNGNSPIPVYGFDVTSGAETRSIKAGIGYERHLTNGRGTLHVYNRSSDDTSNISGTRSSAGDIKVSIDNIGNIGIGITNPGTKLEVVGSIRGGSFPVLVTNTGEAWFGRGNDRTLGTYTLQLGGSSATNTKFEIIDRAWQKLIFAVSGEAPSNAFILSSTGNVGIGTDSPVDKLHVIGNATLVASDTTSLGSGTKIRFYRVADGWEPAQIEQIWTGTNLQGVLAFKTNTDTLGTLTTKMVINNNGNVGIGTTNPSDKLHVIGNIRINGGDILQWSGQAFIQTIGANDIFFRPNSTLRMILTAGGNLGVGNASPGHKLSVQGEIAKYTSTGIDGTFDNFIKYGAAADLQSGATNTNRWIGFDASITAGAAVSNVLKARSFGGGNNNNAPVDIADFKGDQSSYFYGNVTATNTLYIQKNIGGYLSYITAEQTVASAGNSFKFWNSGGSTLLTIGYDGNVGVGATTPAYKLDVSGIARVSDSLFITTATTADAKVEIGSGRSGNGSSYIDLIGDATYTDYGLRLIRSNGGANTTSAITHRGTGIMYITTVDAAPIYLETSNATRMVVASGGNVGIGTTNPATLLHVDTAGADARIRVSAGTNTVQGGMIANTGTSLVYAGSVTNHGFSLRTNDTDRVRIQTDGNVGVGTTTASYKLHVQGDIYARSAVINVNGDLNTLRGNVTTMGYSLTNSPSGAGWITVNTSQNFSGSGDILSQLAYDNYNQQKLFTRYSADYGATWSAWKTIINSDAVSGTTNYVAKFTSANAVGNSLIFDNGSNVAIGSNATAYGRLQISAATTNPSLSATTPADVSLIISNSDIAYGTMFATYSDGKGALQQRRTNAATYYDFSLQPHGGNVGIGVTSPRVLLDLAKTNNVGQVLLLGETGANIRVGFGLAPSSAGMRIFSLNHITDGLIEFGGISSSDGSTWTRNHRLGLAGANSFFNEQGGNVGIGTASPAAKLDIRQTSAATGLKVFTNDTSTAYIAQFIGYDNSLGDTTRMVVQAGGNVGIGTVSPEAKLHALVIPATNATVDDVLKLTSKFPSISNAASAVVGSGPAIVFSGGIGDNQTRDRARIVAVYEGSNVSGLAFHTQNTADIITEKVRFQNNGNVGIGTTNPTSKLTVVQTAGADSVLLELQSNNDSGIRFGRSGYGSLIRHISATTDYIAFNCNGTSQPSVAATAQVVFDENGNVGIGTIVPSALLNIRASAPTSTGGVPTGTNLLIDSNTSNYITFRNTSDNGTYAGLIFLDNNVGGYITFGNSGAAVGSDSMIYGTFNDHIFQNGYVNETLYNRTETMRIKQNGNVGIGITSPAAKLHISDTATSPALGILRIKSTGGNSSITIDSNATSDYSYLTLAQGAVAKFEFGINPTTSDFYLNPNTQVGANNAAVYIKKLDGNVGIGNTSPNNKLAISGSASIGSNYNIAAPTNGLLVEGSVGIGKTTIRLNSILDVNGAGCFGSSGYGFYIGTDATGTFLDAGTQLIRMFAGQVERMRIATDGNIGIGVTSVAAKLHVNSTTSGATLLRADGTNGTLFSVVDDLSDSLMSVNNSAGLPVLEVFADDRVVAGQYGANDFVLVNNKLGLGTNAPIYRFQLGNLTPTSTATPETINLGGTYSNTAGSNIKLRIYDDGIGSYAGMNVSNGQVEVNTWSTGKIAFYRGTTQTAIIDANGNLGIGTATPVTKLDVKGNIFVANAGSGNNIIAFGNIGALGPLSNAPDGLNGNAFLIVDSSTGSGAPSHMKFYTTTGGSVNEVVRFAADGNVGIGTTNPTAKLFVNGTFNVTGTSTLAAVSITAPITSNATEALRINNNNGYISIYNTAGTTRTGYIQGNTANSLTIAAENSAILQFNVAGSEKVRIDTVGNVGIGTTTGTFKLNVFSNADVWHARFGGITGEVRIGGQTGNGAVIQAFIPDSGTFRDLYIQRDGGNVGIGNSSANYKLHVNGNGYFNSTLQVNSNITLSGGGDVIINDSDGTGAFNSFMDSGVGYIRIDDGGSANGTLNINSGTLFVGPSSGNVGIGTNIPSAKLDVIGGINSSAANNFNISSGVYNAIFNNSSTTLSDYNVIRIYQGAAGSATGYFGTGGSTTSNISFRNTFVVGTQSSHDFVLNTTDVERMRITSGGSVGIGTTTPATLLQIGTGTPTAATGGIQFGGDTGTRLYRSASGIVTCSGTIAATFSGALTGNVTGNVSGTAGGETLGTVTGRGASTSNQISVATAAGGSMYTGTKVGASYGDGISGATFKSITDHPTGGSFAFAAYYNGAPGTGTNSFYVSADGSGYFKSLLTTGSISTGAITSAVIKGDAGADYPHSFTNTDAGNTHWVNRNGRLLTSNGAGWQTDGRDPIMALVTSGNSNSLNIANSIGLALHNESQTNNTFSPAIAFSTLSNSGSYNTTYAAIIGKKTGQGVDTNWSAGELHFYAMPVGAYENNIPSLIINSAANVGIGTTNPLARLDVVGAGSGLALSFGITVPNNPLFINTYGGFAGVGMDQATAGIRLAGDYSSGSNPLVDIGYYSSATVSHANWVSRFKVINNGNVGIGTTTPTAKLDVNGTVNFAANVYHSIGGQKFFGGSGGTNNYIYTGTSSFAFLNSSDTSTLMTILNGGNVGIGTSIPGRKLHIYGTQSAIKLSNTGSGAWAGFEWSVGNGAYTAYSGLLDDTGRYFIDVGSNGDDFTILQNGNVGIGTITPVSKLHVEQIQNAESLITIRNNRQDAGDVPLFGISAQNGVTNVSKISFYRGTGGDSGYLTFSTKVDNASSLTEKVRIDGAGNVGIGTISPATLLNISSASADGGKILIQSGTLTNNNRAALLMSAINVNGQVGNVSIECIHPNNQQSDMVFRTGATDATSFGTERMRIDTTGNVGIGTTTPSTLLHAYGSDGRYFTFSGVNGLFAIQRNVVSTGASNPVLSLINTQGMDATGAIGRGTGIQLDLGYGGSLSTVGTAARGARIAALGETIYDATAANQNAVLAFFTSTAGTLTEKVRITSSGNIGIGTTSPATLLQVGTGTPIASGSGIQFGDDTSARIYRDSSTIIKVTGGFQSTTYVQAGNYLQTVGNLIYPASFSATQRLEVGNAAQNAWIDGITIAPGGNVVVAGTLTESSSIRYKENVKTIIAPILPKLNEIRPVTYNKKDNPNNTEYGIIAEELNDLFPELVNKNNNGEVESVNYSRLTVLLIKAVKELKEEIEILKNK